MKFTIIVSGLFLILASCGQKIPFTDKIKEEYSLTVDRNIKKVQFYTSSVIILEKSKSSSNKQTGDDGALVMESSSDKNRVIIPSNTKGIFEAFGPNQEVIVRFEIGVGKTITFAMRPNSSSGYYFLNVKWNGENPGAITYGNESYVATSQSSVAYLMIKLKNLQRTKKKDRVVKGMKVG